MENSLSLSLSKKIRKHVIFTTKEYTASAYSKLPLFDDSRLFPSLWLILRFQETQCAPIHVHKAPTVTDVTKWGPARSYIGS
jgi:hypothetical protein